MSYSLNEIAALAKRSARGAGYSWGLAEELAKATVWLCAHDVDGCAVLAGWLVEKQSTDKACPADTGTQFADMAKQIPAGTHIQHLGAPLLVLPFMAIASSKAQRALCVSCGATTVLVSGNQIDVDGVLTELSENIEITVIDADMIARPMSAPQQTRAFPQPGHLAVLTEFAHRTFAPATEESRKLGAG